MLSIKPKKSRRTDILSHDAVQKILARGKLENYRGTEETNEHRVQPKGVGTRSVPNEIKTLQAELVYLKAERDELKRKLARPWWKKLLRIG